METAYIEVYIMIHTVFLQLNMPKRKKETEREKMQENSQETKSCKRMETTLRYVYVFLNN